MIRLSITAALALCAPLAIAQAPQPKEFTWRAPLELPAGAPLARAVLPAPALMQLQSADARDLRVFNAAGEAVPFAFAGTLRTDPAPPAPRTRAYAALPMYTGDPAKPPKGAVQVRIDDASGGRSLWVQMDGTGPQAPGHVGSALFATQGERQSITGIELNALIPANTPVRISASTSADLAQWTSEPVRGRIYRFDGDGSPVNMTLQFERPLQLDGRYLRLDWRGQEGVSITSVAGLIATPAPRVARVRGELASARPEGTALEFEAGFASPIAALLLSTPRENTLLPIRVLGRNERSQPWRLLGQTVVWRLGGAGTEAATNPALELHGASARWLRVESTHGANLSATPLKAIAEFEPLQIVLLASGNGPFEIAAGRAGTETSGALPLSSLQAAFQGRKLDDLPSASVGAGTTSAADAGPLARWWPGAPPGKTAVLWTVLLLGVLLLAGVAWSLMRQLKTSQDPPPP
jgi:hypothetical protein